MTMLMMMLMMMATTTDSGIFRGVRYVKNNDYAVVLLFDVNGYIAGMQCAVRILFSEMLAGCRTFVTKYQFYRNDKPYEALFVCRCDKGCIKTARGSRKNTKPFAMLWGYFVYQFIISWLHIKIVIGLAKKKEKKVPFHPAR